MKRNPFFRTFSVFLALCLFGLRFGSAADPINPVPCDVNCKIEIEPEKICKGKRKTVGYKITNTGGDVATFTVDAELESGEGGPTGLLNNADVVFENMQPGESRHGAPIVHVSATSARGTMTLKLKVTAPCFSGLEKTTIITVPNASATVTTAGPGNLCERQAGTVIATITNTGDCCEEWTATATIAGPGLEAGQVQGTDTLCPRPGNPVGTMNIPVKAVLLQGEPGAKQPLNGTVVVKVKNADGTAQAEAPALTVQTIDCNGNCCDETVMPPVLDGYVFPKYVGDRFHVSMASDENGVPSPGKRWGSALLDTVVDADPLDSFVLETRAVQREFTEFPIEETSTEKTGELKISFVSGDAGIAEFFSSKSDFTATTSSGLSPLSLGSTIHVRLGPGGDGGGLWQFVGYTGIHVRPLKPGVMKIKAELDPAGSGISKREFVIEIRVTSLRMVFEVAPTVVTKDKELWVGVAFYPAIPEQTAILDGQSVRFNLSSSTSSSEVTAVIANGVAVAKLDVPPLPVIEDTDIDSDHSGNYPAATVSAEYIGSATNITDNYRYSKDNFAQVSSLWAYNSNVTEGEILLDALRQIADGTQILNANIILRDEDGRAVSYSTAQVQMAEGYNSIKSTGGPIFGGYFGSMQIQAPAAEKPGIVVTHVDGVDISTDIPVQTVEGTFSGPNTVNIDSPTSFTIEFQTNASNGTEVIWLDAAPLTGRQVISTSYVQNGKATLTINANNTAGLGTHVIAASVGAKMFWTSFEHTTGSHFQAKFGDRYIAGSANANGTYTFNANSYQLYPGCPPANLPVDNHTVPYAAETNLELMGTPGSFAQVQLVNGADAGFIEVLGLGEDGTIDLPPSGFLSLQVKSKGVFAPNLSDFQAKTIPFRIRFFEEALLSKEWNPNITLVEHTTWTKVTDSFWSFLGADPQTGYGVAASMAGGICIVGDVGAVAKNCYRIAGFSSVPPNYTELVLSGLGLATELAVGVGEAADVPISAVKSIAAYLRGSKFSDILVIMFKRCWQSPVEMAKLTVFLSKVAAKQVLIDGFKVLLTSQELLESAMRVGSRFDTEAETVWEALIRSGAENASPSGAGFATRAIVPVTGGISAAQRALQVLDTLPDAIIQKIKASGKAAEATAGMVKALRQIDGELLAKILANDIFNSAYSYHHLLIDLGKVSHLDGFARLCKTLKNQGTGRFGFLYELQSAVYILAKNPSAAGTFVSKYSRVGNSVTDIDVGAAGVFYQVKRSAAAFRAGGSNATAVGKAQVWIQKARAAGAQSVAYVVPSLNDIPAPVKTFFAANGITPMVVPALGRAASP